MKHPSGCVLAVTALVVFIGTESVIGQFSKATIPGHKIKVVGCYKENPGKRNIPTLLFSDSRGINSKTKVDYRNFQTYILGLVQRCAAATKAKTLTFFGLNNNAECYSGKVSATYARSSTSTDCKNGRGAKCAKNEDCVGGGTTSNFVYKLEALPTTPTKKPTTKPTTKSSSATSKLTAGAKLSALSCQNYLVAIKISAGSAVKPQVPTPAGASTKPTVPAKATKPTVATPGTPAPTPSPQAAIEAKVKNIYKGYSCLVCLKTVNASSSTIFLMLQFTCQGQHMKKLVDGIGASNIIKAECYPPACYNSMYPCPSPCGMPSCSTSPAMPYPPVCAAPMPAPLPPPMPAPPPPPQCPLSCPPICAPNCSPFCCRSMIGHKNRIAQSAKKSSTLKADEFEDDDDDEDKDEDEDEDEEDDDDIDIDESN